MKAIVFTLATLALPAFGTEGGNTIQIHDPNWERPIQRADMKVLDTRYGFDQVDTVEITTTKRDGSGSITGINLVYTIADGFDTWGLEKIKLPRKKRQEVELVVTSSQRVGCGSVMYFASLPEVEGVEQMGRFNVVLTDHTRRICRDLRPFVWEANVRQGFGWCGTMDSVMTLGGNPEAVMTIQNMDQ